MNAVRTSRGHAFGLEIDGDVDLPYLAGAGGGSRRRVSVVHETPAEIDQGWDPDATETLVDRRHDDGRPFLTIERHARLGYRVWSPGYGHYVISPDGRRVRCALPSRSPRWQRLAFAQALPLAATLQRLELFHASAVSLEGRVIAFVAPSGTGKTSVAAHLVAGGARLVTDDVLALESTGGRVVAYPGVGLLCLDPSELARAGLDGRIVGRSDKIHVAVPVLDRPERLDALYYLERGSAGASLGLRPVDPPEPAVLLGSSFITYLRSRRQLSDHLDVCADLARRVRMVRVEVPADVSAAEVAAAVRADEVG